MASELSTGQRLRRERERLNWSQERLAETLGVTTHSINRWERGKVLPHPHYREQLCRVFDKKPEELFVSSEEEPESLPIWMVPHRRNLYFTGREDAIRYLRDTFTTRKTGVSLQTCAISGLGGIGKTQVAIREQAPGPFHPRVAATINNLAVLYERQKRLSEAERYYVRALAIREQTLSPTHTDVANSLHNVATCYYLQGKFEAAESHYLRSLAIHEQSFGPNHPYVAHNLNGLARLYTAQSQYDRAASLYERALAIQEHTLGPEHLDIAITLERYADLSKQMGQIEQAASLEQRAQSIRAKHA